jgi:hypothetical protein
MHSSATKKFQKKIRLKLNRILKLEKFKETQKLLCSNHKIIILSALQ